MEGAMRRSRSSRTSRKTPWSESPRRRALTAPRKGSTPSPSASCECLRLSQLQKMLIELLRRNPESAQRDLALRAGVTQQTVSYNLRILQKQGILQTVSRGRRQVNLATDV